MAADIESARLAPLAGVAFEEFRSTLNTPLPESTHGLLAREETAGMTIRFSGSAQLAVASYRRFGFRRMGESAGWPSGCRLQAELCNSYCTLGRGSLAQSWQMGLSSLKMLNSTLLGP